MRIFRNKRKKTFGSYNFGQYQIYVCEMDDTKGKISRGITVLPSDSVIEVPFPLEKDSAKKLSDYLREVFEEQLPNKHKVKGGSHNYFTSVNFNLNKVKDGMVKGRISMGLLFGCRMVWVSINPSSIKACANAISDMYSNA